MRFGSVLPALIFCLPLHISSQVGHAQTSPVASPALTVNDPLFSAQWYLHQVDPNVVQNQGNVNVLPAWAQTTGSPEIVIAILDDGVDAEHEDLKNNIVPGWDFIANQPYPRPNMPKHVPDHGTACAGLAAAEGFNGKGISGIAPRCKIMPLRVLGESGTENLPNNPTAADQAAYLERQVQRIARALIWAADHGASVLSLSWSPPGADEGAALLPPEIQRALDYATTKGRGGKGCSIFLAVGNQRTDQDGNAYIMSPSVMSVGSVGKQDETLLSSSFSSRLGICAPSSAFDPGEIVTTDVSGPEGYDPGDYTSTFGGTSAAAPLAAGAAALLLSKEPQLSAQQVYARLRQTADKVHPETAFYDSSGHSLNYGFGKLNLQRLLTDVRTPVLTVAEPRPGSEIKSPTKFKVSAANDTLVHLLDFSFRRVHSFPSNPNVELPISMGGATVDDLVDKIEVKETGTIDTVSLLVDAEYDDLYNVFLELIAPDGTRATVLSMWQDWTEKQRTNLKSPLLIPFDLKGKSMQGVWTLRAHLINPKAKAKLKSWAVTFNEPWISAGQTETVGKKGPWEFRWKPDKLTTGNYEVQITPVTTIPNTAVSATVSNLRWK